MPGTDDIISKPGLPCGRPKARLFIYVWQAVTTTTLDTRQQQQQIGHVNEYPTMHHFRIPRHTQSMIA